MYSHLHLWSCFTLQSFHSTIARGRILQIYLIAFKTLNHWLLRRWRSKITTVPFNPLSLLSAFMKTASRDLYKSLLFSAHYHYLRWEDTWEPEEPDSGAGCDLTLISHARTSFHTSLTIARLTPGQASADALNRCGETLSMLMAWLYGSCCFSLRAHECTIKHMKAHIRGRQHSMRTDRCECTKRVHTLFRLD